LALGEVKKRNIGNSNKIFILSPTSKATKTPTPRAQVVKRIIEEHQLYPIMGIGGKIESGVTYCSVCSRTAFSPSWSFKVGSVASWWIGLDQGL